MLLTVLSLEAGLGAADGLGGAAEAGLACGAVDGLAGTISVDTTPLGALLDRSSLGSNGGALGGALGGGGGRERERGVEDATAGTALSGCASMMTGTPLSVFFLGGGLDASRPTVPIWYTSGLFGAAFTGP
jgi:hypothetical protein